MAEPEYYRWATHDELAYLKGLGTHCESPGDRRALLLRYLHAPRADWGSIQAERCLAYARAALTRNESAKTC